MSLNMSEMEKLQEALKEHKPLDNYVRPTPRSTIYFNDGTTKDVHMSYLRLAFIVDKIDLLKVTDQLGELLSSPSIKLYVFRVLLAPIGSDGELQTEGDVGLDKLESNEKNDAVFLWVLRHVLDFFITGASATNEITQPLKHLLGLLGQSIQQQQNAGLIASPSSTA
jgi:hypothetical protein